MALGIDAQAFAVAAEADDPYVGGAVDVEHDEPGRAVGVEHGECLGSRSRRGGGRKQGAPSGPTGASSERSSAITSRSIEPT